MKKKKLFAGIISFLLLFGFVGVDFAQAQSSQSRDPHHPSNSPRDESEYDRRIRIQEENNARERQQRQREAEQQRQEAERQRKQREAEQQRREAEEAQRQEAQRQREAEAQRQRDREALEWFYSFTPDEYK
ncbi:hypothetical protein R84B8_01600 [Treponema sp. R8-4-B8]